MLPVVRSFLATNITNARLACEEAKNAQFNLNAIKSKCEKAAPNELSGLQRDLQQCQDAYMSAVEEAIVLMKLVTENVWQCFTLL